MRDQVTPNSTDHTHTMASSSSDLSFKTGMSRLPKLFPAHFKTHKNTGIRAILPTALSGILPPTHKFVHNCAGEFRAEYDRSACTAYHPEYVRLVAIVMDALEATSSTESTEQALRSAAADLHAWLRMRVAHKGSNSSTATTRHDESRLAAVEAAVRDLATMSTALNGRVQEVENTQGVVQGSIIKLNKMWEHVSAAFSLMTRRRRLVLSDDEEEGEIDDELLDYEDSSE